MADSLFLRGQLATVLIGYRHLSHGRFGTSFDGLSRGLLASISVGLLAAFARLPATFLMAYSPLFPGLSASLFNDILACFAWPIHYNLRWIAYQHPLHSLLASISNGWPNGIFCLACWPLFLMAYGHLMHGMLTRISGGLSASLA